MRLIKSCEMAKNKKRRPKTVKAKRRNLLEKCKEKRQIKNERIPTSFERKLIEFPWTFPLMRVEG